MTYLEKRQLAWEQSLVTEELDTFHAKCDKAFEDSVNDELDAHEIMDSVDPNYDDVEFWDGADDVYLTMLGNRLDNQDDSLEDFAY